MNRILAMLDRLGIVPRAGISLAAGTLTFLASWLTFPKEESFFWAVVVTFSVAMFLLVRRHTSLGEKVKRVGLWDLFVPVILMLVVTVSSPQEVTESVLRENALRLVFAVIFFVGVGTAFRIVFRVTKNE